MSVIEQPPGVAAPGSPRGRRPSPLRTAGRLAGRFALWLFPILLLVAAWWVATAYELVGNEFIAPPPERVWESARDLLATGELQRDFTDTTGRVLTAFALGATVGITLGMMIGRVRPVRLTLRPIASFLFPLPNVALYPTLLIIFGPGDSSKIAVGFAGALFPILFATSSAASAVEPHLEWSARALGASRLSTFARVTLPASLPGILTGMRIGLVGTIITVFIGEMVSAPSGLGQLTSNAANNLRISEMYVGVVAIALTGLLLDRTLLLVRRWLLAWSPEAAGAGDVRGR